LGVDSTKKGITVHLSIPDVSPAVNDQKYKEITQKPSTRF